MARAERIGLAVALVGHALLFGALSLGWLNAPEPPKPMQQPIDVSLVKDVALESAAPVVAPPAPSVAPEQGAPEDAAPPPEEAEPEPAPPTPAPPKPAPPKPVPPKPAPEKPAPKPEPKPQPAPKPVPKPVAKPKPEPRPEPAKPKPAKPQPKAEPEAKPAKPTPAKSAPVKPAPVKAASAKPAATTGAPAKAKPAATTGKGTDVAAKTTRPHGSRLGDDFLKGLADAPAKAAPAAAAPAAKVGAQQAANIASAILRQVQPCANRQVTPGPGAERIRVTINLRLNRDGSLASRPRIVNHDGVDEENRRYLARVDDLAVATFVGCAPLQGLPDSLYDVQNGWSNFTMRYKLPG